MNIFYEKLKEFLQPVNFWKMCLYKMIYNLTSRKFQVFITGLILFAFEMIDQNALLIILGVYISMNITEKIIKKE